MGEGDLTTWESGFLLAAHIPKPQINLVTEYPPPYLLEEQITRFPWQLTA